jgi:hypothetical protein
MVAQSVAGFVKNKALTLGKIMSYHYTGKQVTPGTKAKK